jgi:hypothetical protein
MPARRYLETVLERYLDARIDRCGQPVPIWGAIIVCAENAQ